MKEYTVIALSVGGLNNKVYSAGDTVKETNFKPGRADELVRLGFLNPKQNVVKEEKVIPLVKPQPIPPAPVQEKDSEAKMIDEITVKELKEDLIKRGVSFKPNATKKELFDLWINS